MPITLKKAKVTPVHEKRCRSEPESTGQSYSSQSSEKYLRDIMEHLTGFLDENHPLFPIQYGKWKGRSIFVLLLLLSRSWPYARYADLPPLVIALDNVGGSEFMEQRSTCQSRAAGSFQRLSASFSRYLIDRSLQVAVNRLTEVIFPSETSVSQWPVLGPILLSIYFNNLLQITPHGKCLL